jgi:ADP-ribose pyrophosphatase
MSVTKVSSKLIYGNQWLRLREDVVRRDDGSQGIYSVVEREDFAVVIPFQAGRITLVNQYRYPVGQRLWEAPMGCFEPTRHKDMLDVAASELREETGLIAESLLLAGEVLQGPGYCNQRGHLYFATGLSQGPTDHDHGEMDMFAQDFAVAEVEAMILDNILRCAISVAAFGILRLRGMI